MSPTTSSVSLVRQLGLVSATALVVSNMVGTGIFTTSGFLAGQLGDPTLFLLIWVVGAIAALTGSFCFSELGVNFPASGGEYVYLTRAYGPVWGFITGWVSFFAGFSAPIAVAALAFSDYVGFFAPALKQENAAAIFGSGDWTFKLGGAQMAASALILLFTILNVFGIQRVAKIQNVLTGIKVAVVVAFIGLGFLFGSGDWSHFSQKAVRTVDTPLPQQFAISLFWIYVSYSGWNAATYVAEEIKQPGRTLPKALTFGTMLVAGLYVLLNMVFLYAAPLEEMKGVIAIGSLTASKLFGPQGAGIFSGLMAISLMSTVSAMVTIGPRVYYAMAKNGAFFASAARVHERYRTPVAAILAQGVCASIMTLTPFPQLFFYIGMTLNFTAVLAVASIFVFRRRRPDWQKLGVVSFAYPLVPAIFVLMGAWMTIYGITLQTRVSLLAIGTIALGALVYHFRVARQVREIQ
ncbi:MAG TPA: amino acid permease [Bryobacteraceae bacterium]|nr:amino acid permease [Bryobacteraceae bacterium]